MTKYLVRGIAFVPNEIEIEVEADSHGAAMDYAERVFNQSPRRDNFIVPNSADDGCVFDFQANSAEIVRQQAAKQQPSGEKQA